MFFPKRFRTILAWAGILLIAPRAMAEPQASQEPDDPFKEAMERARTYPMGRPDTTTGSLQLYRDVIERFPFDPRTDEARLRVAYTLGIISTWASEAEAGAIYQDIVDRADPGTELGREILTEYVTFQMSHAKNRVFRNLPRAEAAARQLLDVGQETAPSLLEHQATHMLGKVLVEQGRRREAMELLLDLFDRNSELDTPDYPDYWEELRLNDSTLFSDLGREVWNMTAVVSAAIGPDFENLDYLKKRIEENTHLRFMSEGRLSKAVERYEKQREALRNRRRRRRPSEPSDVGATPAEGEQVPRGRVSQTDSVTERPASASEATSNHESATPEASKNGWSPASKSVALSIMLLSGTLFFLWRRRS